MTGEAARPETSEAWTVPTGASPPYGAVIVDMDGVVTDTAAIHAAAWKALFDGFLAGAAGSGVSPQRPFDAEGDYRRYVDGRAREDGVIAFLSSRGLHLPAGDPADPPGAATVSGLATR